MKNLYRHKLNFKDSEDFVKDNLEDVNTVSIEILKNIDFKKGRFFTLLPPNSNLDRTHEFKAGFIIPQYPMQTQIVSNEKGTYKSYYSKKPSIDRELARLFLKKISQSNVHAHGGS